MAVLVLVVDLLIVFFRDRVKASRVFVLDGLLRGHRVKLIFVVEAGITIALPNLVDALHEASTQRLDIPRIFQIFEHFQSAFN